MASANPATDDDAESSAFGRDLPEFVDWTAAAVIALCGLALSVGGSALAFAVDREMLAEGVRSGEITVVVFERQLTEAEMIEFTQVVVNWAGWGLLVTGVLMVLFAIGYVVVRHRAHAAAGHGESTGSYLSAAVLGAIVTALVSFVPFSPVVGGGVAGYLEGLRSGRELGPGALSGVLGAAPLLAVLLFVTVGLYLGLAGVGAGGLGFVTVAAMLVAVMFVAAFGAGLGAIGGYVGGRIADSWS